MNTLGALLKILFLTFLIGCTFKTSSNQNNEALLDEPLIHNVSLKDVIFEDKKYNLSDFVEEITYIPLSDRMLLSDISYFSILKDKIFILERLRPVVCVFNINGEFERQLFSMGNGPGETKTESPIIINQEAEEVIINGNGSYHMRYKPDGTFLSREKGTDGVDHYKHIILSKGDVDYYYDEWTPLPKGQPLNPDGKVLLTGKNRKTNEVVYTYDNWGYDEKAVRQKYTITSSLFNFNFGCLDSLSWFKHYAIDTVYMVDNQNVVFPKYVFELGRPPLDYRTFVHS